LAQKRADHLKAAEAYYNVAPQAAYRRGVFAGQSTRLLARDRLRSGKIHDCTVVHSIFMPYNLRYL